MPPADAMINDTLTQDGKADQKPSPFPNPSLNTSEFKDPSEKFISYPLPELSSDKPIPDDTQHEILNSQLEKDSSNATASNNSFLLNILTQEGRFVSKAMNYCTQYIKPFSIEDTVDGAIEQLMEIGLTDVLMALPKDLTGHDEGRVVLALCLNMLLLVTIWHLICNLFVRSLGKLMFYLGRHLYIHGLARCPRCPCEKKTGRFLDQLRSMGGWRVVPNNPDIPLEILDTVPYRQTSNSGQPHHASKEKLGQMGLNRVAVLNQNGQSSIRRKTHEDGLYNGTQCTMVDEYEMGTWSSVHRREPLSTFSPVPTAEPAALPVLPPEQLGARPKCHKAKDPAPPPPLPEKKFPLKKGQGGGLHNMNFQDLKGKNKFYEQAAEPVPVAAQEWNDNPPGATGLDYANT